MLIENGANLKATGWVEFKNGWIFGTPLDLATRMMDENENRRKSFQILKLLNPEENETSENLSGGRSERLFTGFCFTTIFQHI